MITRQTGKTQRMLEHALANPGLIPEWPTIILAHCTSYAHDLVRRFAELAQDNGHKVKLNCKDTLTIDNNSVYQFLSILNLDRYMRGRGFLTDILLDNSLEELYYHYKSENTLKSKEMIDFIWENYKEF